MRAHMSRRRLVGLAAAAVTVSAMSLVAAGADNPSEPPIAAFPGLTNVSHDTTLDAIGYHSSEEEPSIASWGQTIVATQQVGRVYDGGASAIGWETSTDGGRTWQQGLLPLTVQAGQRTTDVGPLTRGSDTVVAYDAKHKTWLISTLGLAGNSDVPGVFVNLSRDGIHWSAPIITHATAATADSPDKNWITCDNWPASKGYGNCYEEYDNNGNGNRLLMQVSSDGGRTWSPTSNDVPGNGNTGDVAGQTTLATPANPGDTTINVVSAANLAVGQQVNVDIDPSGGNQETRTITAITGTAVTLDSALQRAHVTGAPTALTTAAPTGTQRAIGGVPLVQPPAPGAAPGSTCGRVVVPFAGGGGISYISSSDCGAHWSAHTQVLPNMTATHRVAQGLRTSLLPMSTIDASGAIYLVWQTNSFRVGGDTTTPNDIAMSVLPAPTDATPYPAFGAPARIPIEADDTTANTNDHFIPGIAADPATSGANAHLGLFYYTYPNAACDYANPGTTNQCNLEVGYVSSTDGGATWSTPRILAQMTLADVVRSSQGPMVGDYTGATVIRSGGPGSRNVGKAISAFAVGVQGHSMNEAMYVPSNGLAITRGATPMLPATAGTAAAPQQAPLNVGPTTLR